MEKVKQKVLLLGSTGMLGHILFHTLKEEGGYEVADLVYRNKLRPESLICDVRDKSKLEKVIMDIQPDYILNCVGVLIKGSTTNPANAIYINAYLPHFLSGIAEKIDARLIHISTDCVFSGKRGGYAESDFRDADDIYGRSKALGELDNDRDLTIRTSIIGPEIKRKGEGLLHWFLQQQGTINGYTEAYWGGVTTLELSKAILEIMKQDIRGLIHLTNGTAISKFEMLELCRSIFGRNDLEIKPYEGKKVDKSLVSERNDFSYEVPAYRDMFVAMCGNMLANRDRYADNYQL